MIHILRANFGLGLWVEICHMTEAVDKKSCRWREEEKTLSNRRFWIVHFFLVPNREPGSGQMATILYYYIIAICLPERIFITRKHLIVTSDR